MPLQTVPTRPATVDIRGMPWLKTGIASWEYRFEPVDGGTRITETWTDDRRAWPDLAARVFDRFATGTSFAEFQRGNIHHTLTRLKSVLEAQAAAR